MKIMDLGEISGDMLLFGGIYSNLQALQAFIAQAKHQGIPAQNCIFTGDVVAYCADPYASVQALRGFACPSLAGNCEVQLAQNALDCGCGFEEGSACSMLSVAWYAHANAQVTTDQRAWMGRLPERIIFSHNGLRYAVIHGAASDISGFIWPTTPQSEFASQIAILRGQLGDIDRVIAGHCGIPFQVEIDDVLWVNAGAIGLPAHNGSPQTHYVSIVNNTLKINMLKYDVNAAFTAMQTAGLIQGYHDTLKSGYWPSQDTLPADMRL